MTTNKTPVPCTCGTLTCQGLKPCRGCKYSKLNVLCIDCSDCETICRHPNCEPKEATYWDYYSGTEEPTEWIQTTCQQARSNNALCGHKGKYWEAR